MTTYETIWLIGLVSVLIAMLFAWLWALRKLWRDWIRPLFVKPATTKFIHYGDD